MAGLDDLFNNPEAGNFFNQTTEQVAKSAKQPVQLNWGNLGRGFVGAVYLPTAISNLRGIADEYRYNKSLKDYQNVAFQNYLNRLGRQPSLAERINELQREQRDFTNLYYQNNPKAGTMAQQGFRRLVQPFVQPVPQQVIQQVEIPTEKQAEVKQPANKTQNTSAAYTPVKGTAKNTAAFINALTDKYGIQPGENIGGTGYTVDPQGKVIPVNQGETQMQGQPTGGAANLSLDEILNIAKAYNQMQNQPNTDYINALTAAINNQSNNYRNSLRRDLAIAGLANLPGANPYMGQLVGRYNPNQEAAAKLALQQQLARAQQAQIFNPLPIIGNAALMEQLGLPVQASVADENAMKMYSNVYGTQQGAMNNAYRLAQQAAALQDKLDFETNKFNQELAEKKREYDNPRFNNLAAQASLASSILNQAQFNPNIRSAITPEFVQYMMNLTGYNGYQPPVPPSMQGQGGNVDLGLGR